MIYAKTMDWLAEFIGWNLSVPRGERRFKFKICSVWLDARCAADGGNFIADLSSWHNNGRRCACALRASLAVKGRTALRRLLLRQRQR